MCNECNLIKVKSLINSLPQIQKQIDEPRTGIVAIILLKTVKPQYDIIVHGKTYPIKAIIITKK